MHGISYNCVLKEYSGRSGIETRSSKRREDKALHNVNAASVSIFFLLQLKRSEIFTHLSQKVVSIVLFGLLPEVV
jgi:hypothetical protein